MFLLKVMPMLPSRALNWVTPEPVIEKLEYPTHSGPAAGDVYRPSGRGPHPAMVICLGVVPFGVDHPQIPRLGEAFARSGFAVLMYWSTAMRDFRLDTEDIDNIALAYECLAQQPYVDERRSGLFGTCVGGSFALMAAASPRIRERVAFVGAFAPYGSLFSLARDVASSSREAEGGRRTWEVDPLTQKVFVHSITARLSPGEATMLREASRAGLSKLCGLSPEGRSICELLLASNSDEATAALAALPEDIRASLAELSPVEYLNRIQAPLIAISHDRDDTVIPVGESRLLRSRLLGRRDLCYTEFEMFQHADPTKRKLSPLRLLWQLSKFYSWLNAVFRKASG